MNRPAGPTAEGLEVPVDDQVFAMAAIDRARMPADALHRMKLPRQARIMYADPFVPHRLYAQ